MSVLHDLHNLLQHPESEIDLAEAALLIAKNEYPELDVARYLRYFDELALRVLARLKTPEARPNLVMALNHVLFEEEGFVDSGPEQHDPRNSFLNQVLERKEGSAVTLSIIYLEVGWRVGLPLEGVPFPGHFLIKMPVGEKNLVVLDPAGGYALSTGMLMDRLRRATGGSAGTGQLSYVLGSVGRRDIIRYMLEGLREIYLYHRQWGKLLQIYEELLIVKPGLPRLWLERAEVCYKLECFRWALDSYRHYRELGADEDEVDGLEARIHDLEQQIRHLN